MPPPSGFLKTLQSSQDEGGRIALDALRKNPTWIQPVVLKESDGYFLPEAVLRKGPPAPSGAIAYRMPEPLYSDDDIEIIGEAGTFPAMTNSRGPVRMSATQKRGAAIEMTQEMIDRGNAEQFMENMRRNVRTFTRSWSRVFLKEVLSNMEIPQMTVRASGLEDGWHGDETLSGANELNKQGIRRDIALAHYTLKNAHPVGRPDEKYGYTANTLVIHPLTAEALTTNEEMNKIYMMSPEVSSALNFTMKLPRTINGTTVLQSWDMPVDSEGVPTKALLLERNTLGFISDEKPFQTTPLYENKDNETWRSNMKRTSTMCIDNPLAAIWLNGINGVHT